jgi:hypothetical protein
LLKKGIFLEKKEKGKFLAENAEGKYALPQKEIGRAPRPMLRWAPRQMPWSWMLW